LAARGNPPAIDDHKYLVVIIGPRHELKIQGMALPTVDRDDLGFLAHD
jgi:hypothetical protein